MRYTVWVDAEGRKIKLEDMSDSYIKNCIKEIERLLPTWQVKLKSREIDIPFSESWLVTHGENYLEAFEQEKTIRRRIAREEYPVVFISKNCGTCDFKRSCPDSQDDPIDCGEWEPNNIAVQEALSSEIDREIFYRTHTCIVK